VLRAIIPPLVAAYVVFVVLVILAWRRPGPPPPGWRARTHAPERESQGSSLATAIWGYVVFLAIVLVFTSGWRGNPMRSSAPFGVDCSSR
jgi:hypothetical protein